MKEDYFTVNELAEHFRVNPKTIYRRLQKRTIPGFRYNRTWGNRHYLMIIPAWFAEKFKRLEEVDKWQEPYRHYRYVSNPSHPRANRLGKVGEHILVWEKKHKRTLPPDWMVHHINGIKGDNRLENLQAMSKLDHRRLHNKEMWERRKGYEGNNRAIS